MAHKTKKKPARKQAKKPVKRLTRPASRKSRATRTKAVAKARKQKTTAVKARKAAKPARSKALKKVKKTLTRAAKPKVMARKAIVKAPAPITAKRAPMRRPETAPPARLQRERRRLPEAEEEESFAEARDDSRMMHAARAGHDELRSEIRKQTANSPTMTAGDVDAKWQDAYALGDEAPGGDNMTPDQDRVDDIGKALGIEYADDEELLGGEELTERDEHRWELDPASKDEDDDL